MGTRQLRLSDSDEIRSRIRNFLGKKINVVLSDNTVMFGILKEVSQTEILLVNMRMKRSWYTVVKDQGRLSRYHCLMLKHLTIRNYALIRQLVLEPSGQLNVITGETGAGKSILLGAMGLLMGNRADSRVLWDEDQKCVIEGTFSIGEYKLKSIFKSEDLDYDDTTVIRRELSPGGKSRAFINDTPVSVEVMKRITNSLMDIHSQHETLQLGHHAFQLRLVDAFAGNQSLLEKYSDHWATYLKAKKELETLTNEADALRQEADYIAFQLEELTKAQLRSVRTEYP